jgi:glycosyltransferase involved in cell wall biosynthesis
MSDGIIVHNNYSKRFAEEVYKINANKLFVIPHGNFLDYYPENPSSSEETRKRLGISPDKFVLMFFGIIRHYKGIDLLLRSFEGVVKRNPKLFLLIAGKCSDAKLRTELIRFQARFPENCMIKTDYIPDNEVSILMKIADIGILPYSEIASSGVALLFMSFGLPIIASNLPAMREILEDAPSIYFAKNDPKSLEEAILIASRQPKLSKSSRGEIVESVKSFAWPIIADKTISAYWSLIQKRARMK